MNGIIDNDGLAQIAAKSVQVLDEHVKVGDGRAVLPVQPITEEFIARIEQLEASVCVGFLYGQRSGCE